MCWESSTVLRLSSFSFSSVVCLLRASPHPTVVSLLFQLLPKLGKQRKKKKNKEETVQMFSTFFWRCEPAARAWWEKLRLKRWKTGGKSPVSESSGVELSHFWALLSFSHTSRLIRGLSVICNSAHKAHDTLCSYFSSTLTNPALNVSGPQFPI